MAVYTHISGEELAAHLARYDLGALASFSGIGPGVSNTNYLLETAAGKFILTLFEGRTDVADLPFFFSYMAHLGAKGLPVAAVVKDRAGKIVTQIEGKASAITTFLPGGEHAAPSAADCAAMGAMLARMHTAAADFSQTRANGMALPEWKRLIASSQGRADGIAEGLSARLEKELALIEGAWPQDLPQGAVHADLFPDNVFFGAGGEISGLIDFYFSCTEFFAYDLMLTANGWCFDRNGDAVEGNMKALLAAYNASRPLSAREIAALPLMGRAAALRIVATRVYDLLHPAEGAILTPKDPRPMLRILDFHAGVSSPAAYGLAA